MKIFTNESILLKKGMLKSIRSQTKDVIVLYSDVKREVVENLRDGVDNLALSYLNENGKLVIKITEKSDGDEFPNEKTVGLFFNSEYGFSPYLEDEDSDVGSVILNEVFQGYIPLKTAQALILELTDGSSDVGVVMKTRKGLTEGNAYLLKDTGWKEVEGWELNNDNFVVINDNAS